MTAISTHISVHHIARMKAVVRSYTGAPLILYLHNDTSIYEDSQIVMHMTDAVLARKLCDVINKTIADHGDAENDALDHDFELAMQKDMGNGLSVVTPGGDLIPGAEF